MKKVLILGCGFAGLSAAAEFCRARSGFEVTVIDKKRYLDFLPLLPDVIGRGINAEYLRFPLAAAAVRLGFTFVNAYVGSLDPSARRVISSAGEFGYDYLLLASGSETNFYGNAQAARSAYKLDDAGDAVNILLALERRKLDCCVVSGGGYTGIEIATNLRLYFSRRGEDKEIIIIEKSPSILGPLPSWMKGHVYNNLRGLGIRVLANTVIEQIEERSLRAAGEIFNNSMLVWAAGVRVSDIVRGEAFERNPQGRYKVDEFLRLCDNCFAAGDASCFSFRGGFLRMAVQFAISQGACAGRNIINAAEGRKLKRYEPHDLGYIIPMANNNSCGQVLGISVKGAAPTALHYLMCLYRSLGWRNRAGIIRGLFKKRR
ncbi:MAG: FAD-dependent oxidoreductase [Candidatus Omnitrophota bacterium]